MKDEGERVGGTVVVGVSQFPALAAGSVLFLSSPSLVCTAIQHGTWAEETEHFLHKFAHHDDGIEPLQHMHDYMDGHGLEGVLQELRSHYEPSDNKVHKYNLMASKT